MRHESFLEIVNTVTTLTFAQDRQFAGIQRFAGT
jgi:hypothetical protein